RDNYACFVTIGNARFTSNTATNYGLYDVEGVDALYPLWYGEFMGYIASSGRSLALQDRISAWFAPEIKNASDWESPFVINFLTLAGVKYIVTKDNFLPPPQISFNLVYGYKNWTIYSFRNPLPKATFMTVYEVIPSKEALLRRLFDANFDPRKTILFFEVPAIKSDDSVQGIAEVTSYQPQQIEIQSNSNGPGFVFVNDSYFPNWFALVDGKVTPVLQADYTFRAVPIPSGRHQIILRYRYL
ncbi:YfhO family protein, partial [Candidatus Gottesmanbacteria bacterium]|nr:YfhO family protein [Candidatus Gottesmanbacteria bacterium]